jgi:hypothetical protein
LYPFQTEITIRYADFPPGFKGVEADDPIPRLSCFDLLRFLFGVGIDLVRSWYVFGFIRVMEVKPP